MIPHQSIAERIDALLPQTQCGQCGYDGCRPYAAAIAGGAPINRCPPGGAATLAALAALLALPVVALDPACGAEKPRTLALIDEENCIGCTLCIQACPVDAIAGAARQMHTVLAEWCTGCELCVPPCPVDCIALLPHPVPEISPVFAGLSRERHVRRAARLKRDKTEHPGKCGRAAEVAAGEAAAARKRRIVAAAVAAAKQRHRAP